MCLNDLRGILGPSTQIKVLDGENYGSIVNPTYIYKDCFGCLPFTTIGKMKIKFMHISDGQLIITAVN